MNEKRHKTIKEPISSSGENGLKGVEPCKPYTLLLPEICKTTEDEKIKTKERERTTARKKIFLAAWGGTLGSVKATCERANVPRQTFYDWMHADPEFAMEIRAHEKQMLEDLDQAGKLQILKGDSAMIRFYLERRHPLFQARLKIEGPKEGEKSLEQEFDMMTFMNDNEVYGETANKQLDGDSKKVLAPGQTGSAGAAKT